MYYFYSSENFLRFSSVMKYNFLSILCMYTNFLLCISQINISELRNPRTLFLPSKCLFEYFVTTDSLNPRAFFLHETGTRTEGFVVPVDVFDSSLDQSTKSFSISSQKMPHFFTFILGRKYIEAFKQYRFLFLSCYILISKSYSTLFGMSSMCVCTFLCVVSTFPCIISFRSGEFCHAAFNSGKSLSATASPTNDPLLEKHVWP